MRMLAGVSVSTSKSGNYARGVRRVLRILLAGVIGASVSSSADDQVYAPLHEVVRAADFIGRVELEHREALVFRHGGAEHVCGFVYRAKVQEAIKGAQTILSFFSTRDAEVAGHYFVVANQRDEETYERVRAMITERLTGFERERKLCISIGSEYGVTDDPQSLVPMIAVRSAEIRDMFVAREPNGFLDVYGFPISSITVDGQAFDVVDWAEVRRRLAIPADE